MAKVGFHFSHEQYSPSHLLKIAKEVDASGFTAGMCSDHLAPWTTSQGQSGYTWSWLGSALEATKMDFGTVTAPGQRYHPVILAQKIATLCDLYPGRVWISFGSGEFINEHVTGEPWPDKQSRNQRLRESIEIIRALLKGETVSHAGFVEVKEAKLYTLPSKQPLLIGAALSPETAKFLGSFTDGLVTVGNEPDQLKKMTAAYREGGGSGKPLFLQEQISYAPTYEEALNAAVDQWAMSALPSHRLADVRTVHDFDELVKKVEPKDVLKSVRVSNDFQQHAKWLQQNVDLGFDRIYLHNVCREHQNFGALFKQHVFPSVKGLEL